MTTSIQIHADPSCPWCYLGVSNFERARLDFDLEIFDITTAPFLINPDLPANGMEFQEYLMARYGDQKDIAEALLPLQKGAETSEVPLHLEKIKIMPNTLKAQLLLHWAREISADYPLLREMQLAHFVKGLDLSDHAVLRAMAENVGMDGKTVSSMLAEARDEEVVLEEIRVHTQAGIREVPTFILGNTYAVPGVQSVSFWRNVISEIDEKGRELTAQRPIN